MSKAMSSHTMVVVVNEVTWHWILFVAPFFFAFLFILFSCFFCVLMKKVKVAGKVNEHYDSLPKMEKALPRHINLSLSLSSLFSHSVCNVNTMRSVPTRCWWTIATLLVCCWKVSNLHIVIASAMMGANCFPWESWLSSVREGKYQGLTIIIRIFDGFMFGWGKLLAIRRCFESKLSFYCIDENCLLLHACTGDIFYVHPSTLVQSAIFYLFFMFITSLKVLFTFRMCDA